MQFKSYKCLDKNFIWASAEYTKFYRFNPEEFYKMAHTCALLQNSTR
jgi:hypothetical protein